MADSTRYSDEDLKEFKTIILDKLKEAEEDVKLLTSQLRNDNSGTNDTSRSFNIMEDGSLTLSREEMAIQASRQQKFIENLKNALIRIENKTYGVCRVTGHLIKKERLRLVPHATMSIEAKQKLEK
jgi:DnaK suppressor protein